MDHLETALAAMDESMIKGLKTYLLRVKGSERTTKLMDLLRARPESSGPELAALLYKPVNLNAYHSLRKSLMAQVEEFIALRQIIREGNNPNRVLAISQFFIENNDIKAAAAFIKKATVLAEKNRDYTMLDSLLLLQIERAHELHLDPNQLIHRWEQNRSKRAMHEKLIVAQSLLKRRLADARKAGTILRPEEIVEEVFKSFNLKTEEAMDASFALSVTLMIRSAVVSSKEYSRFEPFVIRIYNRLIKAEAFGKQNEMVRQQFIYIIAHTYYRTRQLAETIKWLDTVEHPLPAVYSRFIQLRAATLSFSGHNDQGIEILSTALKTKDARFSLEDRLNMRLNLVVFHFQSQEFKKANVEMLRINHSDAWIEKKMGKEWRFKRSMIDVILQYELGNTEQAFGKIKVMEKYFAGFFQHPAYSRALIFMRFVKTIIEHPEKVRIPAFAEEVDQANMAWPDHKEDTQAITFFCWLKSRMINKPYYEVLLQAMQTPSK